MLRDRRKNVQGQSVRLRHVHCDELHAAFHKVRDEGDGAGEAVQLGDDQHRPLASAQIERNGELGPVVLPSALHLHELG